MNYGYFDDFTREYVITNPKTPVKWVNYVGTLNFGGLVDHTGGLLLCKGDPALNRITKYIPQLPGSDFKGQTLYLRLRQNNGYKVFSPYFVPTLDSYTRFECRVGLGYTRISSEFYGISTESTIFVPPGESCLVCCITITNLTAAPLDIQAIPVVEYTHPDALKQFTNADWVPQTMQSRLAEKTNGPKILLQYPFMFRDSKINYFTANLPVSSFESDRRLFLGDNEYGTWANPLSLQQPELSNTQAQRGDNIAALLIHLWGMQPGESRQIITLLGQAQSVATAMPTIKKLSNPIEVTTALKSLSDFWNTYLAKFQVHTPSHSFNQMINVYNPRQCYITKNWSRYLSLYQLGLGARGMGFRDSAQDVLGILGNVPEEGKALISQLLQVQKQNGSAMHQFNPLTMIANEGDAREMEDRPQFYSDDQLWIVLAISAYLKETGDMAFLDQEIPFYEKDKQEKPLELGTVREHLHRAVTFTHNTVGAHGLPLLGFADWNDTINLSPGAESLFTANLYGAALRELIELAQESNDSVSVQRYTDWYQQMGNTVNRYGWDGAWYIRYFDADGTPLGSHRNQHGQIYTNGQSWPVISGFADPDQARRALDSVYQRLNTRYGIKLSTPGFNGYDPAKGGVTTYPPGAKENGGIFLHANPWVIIAETLLGNGNRAFEYYAQINPAAQNDRLDQYQCEPYVYPQNVLGDEHPQLGLARNSWLSGTASWMYQAGTKYILGIKPTYTGLRISPVIPTDWDGFTAVRLFRGVLYRIDVRREGPGNTATLSVNGIPIGGTIIPLPAASETEVLVQVIIR